MSILGLFIVGSLAVVLGLAIALAFARAALYANALTERGGTRRTPPRRRRDALSAAVRLEDVAVPRAGRAREPALPGPSGRRTPRDRAVPRA